VSFAHETAWFKPRGQRGEIPSLGQLQKLTTWNLELGIWNLELGTWNLERSAHLFCFQTNRLKSTFGGATGIKQGAIVASGCFQWQPLLICRGYKSDANDTFLSFSSCLPHVGF
jgi:hypothetical protein